MKMSGIKELIRTEEDGTLSFGAYELAEKVKNPITSIREISIK